MKRSVIVILLLLPFIVWGQKIEVPTQLEFAGIKLKIKEDARGEIQEDINALTQNERFFLNRLSKVVEYFPIIEKIFAEEGLPDDFKYLIIQESAFIPDAVSSSNAVGYWQFKKETALEVGMRVDSRIDERMHIIPSTRGAARYLQKNNYFFNNWLNALQAYQMGAGGALEALGGDKDSGASTMVIDKKTYWYVKKYLAHKIAFEAGLKMYKPQGNSLVEFTRGENKSLKEIAKEVNVEENLLASYNKWLHVKKIPPGENYIVIVPLQRIDNVDLIAKKQNLVAPDFDQVRQKVSPTVTKSNQEKPFLVTINSLKGILASKGSTLTSLASQGDLSVKDLAKYNDLEPGQKIKEDQIYYLEKKRSRGKIYFHTVEKDETLWAISQKYGIKLSKVAKFNRLEEKPTLTNGLVLWLHKKRPVDIPPKILNQETESTELIVAKDGLEARNLATSSEIFNKEVVRLEETLDLDSLVSHTTDTVGFQTSDIDEIEESKGGEPDVQENSVKEIYEEGGTAGFESELKDAELSVDEQNEKVFNLAQVRIHKVAQGETLFSISKIYGISIEELRVWNSIEDVNSLKMDQELKIMQEKMKLEKELDKTYTKHEVAAGDTLYRISKLYDVSLNDLLKWNNKNSSELKIGETLLIKK
jgi:membrane-bound lytic murein transglycosylase D